MERDRIEVHQNVKMVRENGKIVGVEINVYPHFGATPASLRRRFDALIADKIQNFVGRQFVWDALDDYLRSHSSGYFVIRGVPGIGKSALMAKLVNDRGYVHHFNIASQNIRAPRTFLDNVCAQLISRYQLPHEELPQDAGNDSGFLMQCLHEAAEDSQNLPIVVAVDALDEADRATLVPTANSLYLPGSLPRGVFFIVTTRPLADMRLHVSQSQVLDLDADSEGNLRDIADYIAGYAQREPMRARLASLSVTADGFVETLRKKSQGNFMYLYHALPAIERGTFFKGALDELPDGLLAYYQNHWRQMHAASEREFDGMYEPIICILGVAQEPVTIRQISAWTKLRPGQVRKALDQWREFLETEQADEQTTYRIYHASFQDFLQDQVDLERYDDMIADYYLSLDGPVDA